jgi:hypothetical protein
MQRKIRQCGVVDHPWFPKAMCEVVFHQICFGHSTIAPQDMNIIAIGIARQCPEAGSPGDIKWSMLVPILIGGDAGDGDSSTMITSGNRLTATASSGQAVLM